MGFVEDFIQMFGFTKYSTIIAIVCMVSLLGNFFGGMMTSIILAHGGPIRDLPMTQRTSFRLAAFAEALVIIYAVFYHAFLVGKINLAQSFLWGFTILASPLLAALGAQITYLVFAKQIEEKKAEYRNRQRAESKARMAEQNGEE